MKEHNQRLWLHAYGGHENGLMVIGSPDGLRKLGEQLIEGNPLSEPTIPGWPATIARPDVLGPYTDVPDFTLSFHIIGDSQPGVITPHRRRDMHPAIFIAVGVCALVGVITIVQWALHHVL